MAQHDYIIDNQSAPSSRADLNAALQAIVSQNSGNTAPATTYANMFWYETDTNILKKRNEANTAWISVGTFDEATSTFNPNQTLASQAEAEAGVENTKPMTSLRTAEAIAAMSSSVDYQVFTASGTWTKPAGVSANAIVIVMAWGGGGAGGDSLGNVTSGTGGGGGGGGFFEYVFRAADLTATEAVVVGAGGTAVSGAAGNSGGTSTFAGESAWGGAGGQSRNSANPIASGGGSPGVDGSMPGDGDIWTGGGGASGSAFSGGYGTNGGGGGGSSGGGAGGLSSRGGNGGAGATNANATSGSAPGGGGGGCAGSSGAAGNGARGEVRVWTIG